MKKIKHGKYKDLVNEMIAQIYTEENLKKRERTIQRKDEFLKKYSRGGESMERGYYCPSLVEEIIVTNISRGKLLKRLTKKAPDYCYYFHEGKLVLVQKNNEFDDQDFEWIERIGEIEYSIRHWDGDNTIMLILSKYRQDKIIENSFLTLMDPNTYYLELENYEYDAEGKLCHAERKRYDFHNGNAYEYIFVFDFLYNPQGDLQKCIINRIEEEVLVRIPPKNRELITGRKVSYKDKLTDGVLTEKIKEITGRWTKEDLYAISIFIENDGNQVTDFALSYNPEQNQTGEERWNYAFWVQDEVNLLGFLDERPPIGYTKLLNLCAEAVATLQNEGYFRTTFHRNVPVIIHGYEYTKKELEATKKANPNGEANAFLEYMG